jgi:hypothetical protein
MFARLAKLGQYSAVAVSGSAGLVHLIRLGLGATAQADDGKDCDRG